MGGNDESMRKRDYDKERDELLRVVAEVTPAEVRAAIELTAQYAQPLPAEQVVAEVSYEGSRANS